MLSLSVCVCVCFCVCVCVGGRKNINTVCGALPVMYMTEKTVSWVAEFSTDVRVMVVSLTKVAFVLWSTT